MTEPSNDPSGEEALREAFGRVVGFTLAAILLGLGGGILLIVLAAVFFGFIFGG